jgi:copper chaperone CopZ
MCSYAVHSELEKLPFVEKTVLDLNTNVAQVTFKKDIKVNMQEVVNAVYKAGFSVGYTHADFNFDQLAISDQYTFNYQGDDYVFLKPNTPFLEGVISLKFLNKKFLRKKSHDFWSPMIKENLKGKTITKEHLIFFVTL